MKLSERIIVALDYPEAESAFACITALQDTDCAFKVGKELFTREGPELVRKIVGANKRVFLDLKFHDIPNTVAAACKAAADLGVWMLNVHASGGREMLRAARGAVDEARTPPLLVGVTVLTSLAAADLRDLGVGATPAAQVSRLAALAHASGLDGVVCSPQEIATLKQELGAGFITVTPGIRPADTSQDDQQRVATPAAAIAAGGDYLVIGRPITRAASPRDAVAALVREIAQAQS